MKALGIVRISTVKQEMEMQRAELLDFIKSDGYTDDDIITVEGEGASAIKLDDYYLENMEKVKAHIEKGGIKCVYAWAIDRIGRDEEFLMGFKKFLVKHNVNLKIKNPAICLFDNEGKINAGMELAFSLYATMAKQEMEQKKARFNRSRKRNAEIGKYNGGNNRKFGYYVDDKGFFQPDEEGEAKLVKQLFSMYASGNYTLSKLGKEMEELGYERLNNTVFLSRILNYRGYTGEPVGDKLLTKYPRIISNETFEKVQAILKQNSKSADKQYKHHYFGNGVLRCPCCGGKMTGARSEYLCYNAMMKSTRKCTSKYQRIAIDFMDGLLFQIAANEHLLFLARNSELEAKRIKNDISINLDKKNALVAAGEAVNGKIERAKNLYLKGLSTEEELDKTVARIKREDDARKNKMLEYDEIIESLEKQLELLDDPTDYENLFNSWDKVLEEKDELERQKIVKAYIKRAEVTKEDLYKYIKIELVSGETMRFRYRPHVKFGRRLFKIDGDKETPYIEYYVKRAY